MQGGVLVFPWQQHRGCRVLGLVRASPVTAGVTLLLTLALGDMDVAECWPDRLFLSVSLLTDANWAQSVGGVRLPVLRLV